MQVVDNEKYDILLIQEKFEKEIDSMKSQSSQTYYRQAITSFFDFARGIDKSSIEFSYTLITDWIVEMYRQGMSHKTHILYLDVVGSLYNRLAKTGLIPQTKVFRDIKLKLNAIN